MLNTTVRGVVLLWSLALMPGCGPSDQPLEGPVSLKLGGKMCDLYLSAVEEALLGVQGVAEVDVTTRKGYAIVTLEGATVTAGALIDAVDHVKGKDWHCEATLSQ